MALGLIWWVSLTKAAINAKVGLTARFAAGVAVKVGSWLDLAGFDD
ncbi:MAG: hypothetical protein ACI4JT_05460 [Oscillospiraceae bacterium]